MEINFSLNSFELSDYPSAKIKIDEFILEWLNINETSKLIDYLLDEVSLRLSEGTLTSNNNNSNSNIPDIPNINPPPRSPNSNRSPKKRLQSEISNISTDNNHNNGNNNKGDKNFNTRGSNESEDDTQTTRRRSNIDSIPVFFIRTKGHHSRKPILEDQLVLRLSEIESYFKPYPNGIPFENFVHITKGLCGLPSFFNLPLCRRIVTLYPQSNDKAHNNNNTNNNSKAPRTNPIQNPTNKITLKTFLLFWQNEIEPYDRYERFFRLVKQPLSNVNYIIKDDFVPFIQELLHFHPGLEFLENHDEFQRKYALTVIARIFYKVNLSRTGKLSLREIYASNLIHEFMHVDEETDINRVTEYFSYEHFYVLYCRFFELDSDKDSKLTRDDLLKYSEHSLSEAIVDRIFQVGCRAFSDGKEGGFQNTGMTYSDFVYFMLAEEDKGCEASLRYWFACCDLDSNDVITSDELRYFYRSQLHRITSLGQDTVSFADVMCQMIDMISPADQYAITLDDLLKPNKMGYSGVLFDALFNLHKFLRFETRDPFQEKQRREDIFDNDWDRFAQLEYHRLAAEEEENSYEANGTMEIELGQQNESKYQQSYRGNSGNVVGNADWSIDDEDDEEDDLVMSRNSLEMKRNQQYKGR